MDGIDAFRAPHVGVASQFKLPLNTANDTFQASASCDHHTLHLQRALQVIPLSTCSIAQLLTVAVCDGVLLITVTAEYSRIWSISVDIFRFKICVP